MPAPSRGPRLLHPSSSPLSRRTPADSAPRRSCHSVGTIYLLSLPVREPSTWEWSRRSVRPIAIARESLRLVEPVGYRGALTSICLPVVRSFRIHLPGALRSTGVTRLGVPACGSATYGSSDSYRALVRCPVGLIVSCIESSNHSVSNHPSSLQLPGSFLQPDVPSRRITGSVSPTQAGHRQRQLGFA
jgi:hypothetical protein